jgi:hypothetical protein
MDNSEKELLSIAPNNKKKIDNLKKDYTNNQKWLQIELFSKQINNMIPIEFKIFANKFIKMKNFEKGDDIETIINKISENLEM